MMRPLATFSFFIFSLSSSLLPPRPSFATLLPPRPSFASLLPPHPSLLVTPSSLPLFFPHAALNHLQPFKAHFSSILTKALRTDRPTDQRTNGPTDKADYRDADASKKTQKRYNQRFPMPPCLFHRCELFS